MEIGITKTLAKKTGETPLSPEESTDLFYCWDAHIVRYGSRQALILINVKTRLASLLINLKPRDWKDMKTTAIEAITSAMSHCGCREEEIERYFQKAGDLSITKTHGRTSTGVINLYNRTIDFHTDLMDPDARYQRECTAMLHGDILDIPELGQKRYTSPYDYFLLCLEEHDLLGLNL
jgi:hypothetical protein